MLRCGDTFLLPKAPCLKEHLWIIITDPELGTNTAACVNVTTRDHHSETTVLLQVGDHPFITRESVIYYVDSRILNLNAVEQMLKTKTTRFACAQHAACSPALLKRVQDGLLKSKFASNGIKEYCAARWKLSSSEAGDL